MVKSIWSVRLSWFHFIGGGLGTWSRVEGGRICKANPLFDCAKGIGHKRQSHLAFLVFLHQGIVRTEI